MPKASNPNKKTRTRTAPNKNWTDEECYSLLFYILDKQNEGKEFEKPTHERYYEALIRNLNWTGVKWQQVKAKMGNLRTKYVEIRKWLEKTGQGVDSGTIKAYKETKCKFYDTLEMIYGCKANIAVPYVYDSLVTNKKAGEMQTNQESSQNAVDANVIGEIEVNGDGDVVGSSIADENLDALSLIDVDSFLENYSVSDTEDTQHTQPDHGTAASLSDQQRHFVPNNEDMQSSQSDLEVEYLGSGGNVPNLRETSSISQTNNGPNTRPSTEDEIAFSIFASRVFGEPEREHEQEQEQEQGNESNESRIARYKKQLSERSSSQPHTRNIPSNAAAFVSDANLKRAETLHERNKIEMRRVENENTEISISKQRFELDKVLLVQQMELNKKESNSRDEELRAKYDLRTQNFELKCKKLALKEKEKAEEFSLKRLEIEKSERLERMKIEYEFKLQLELAKLKSA